MLWGKHIVKLFKVLKLHIKNADKREWDKIDRIYIWRWETTNNNSKRLLGGEGDGGIGGLTMSSIYDQGIYSNGNCSGIFVWHLMYHVSQNTKLQSVAERQNLVEEFCYLSECWGRSLQIQQNWNTQKKEISAQIQTLNSFYKTAFWQWRFYGGRFWDLTAKKLKAPAEGESVEGALLLLWCFNNQTNMNWSLSLSLAT